MALPLLLEELVQPRAWRVARRGGDGHRQRGGNNKGNSGYFHLAILV
jgi:hypothetical protein